MESSRITSALERAWGTPFVRDTDVSVGHVVNLQRSGQSVRRILEVYPELTADDVDAALDWYLDFGPDALLPSPPDPGDRHPLIAVDPQVQGGVPTLRGTRITVDAVCGLWVAGFNIDQIVDELPGLTPDMVEAAIDYDLDVRDPASRRAGSDRAGSDRAGADR